MTRKIFVGGIPQEISEREFADYFGTFGPLKVRFRFCSTLNLYSSGSVFYDITFTLCYVCYVFDLFHFELFLFL